MVVDAGTRDRTAEVAKRAGATIVLLADVRGRTVARNAGIGRASGEWIAFTDADCVPSRRWLPTLLAAAQSADRSTLALAGKTIGLDSKTPAARFVDLIGALDAETYLRHETMPWAPSGNLACRRADLLAVGGFDPGFKSYEAADLLLRMTERFGGRILYVPTAVVMHHHRSTWLEFWKQQLSYGGGYATISFAVCGPLAMVSRPRTGRMETHRTFRRSCLRHARRCQSGSAWTFCKMPGPTRWVRFGIFFITTPSTPTNRTGKETCMKPPTPLLMPGSKFPLWLAVGHFILRAPVRLAANGFALVSCPASRLNRAETRIFCESREFIAAGCGCRGCVRATRATFDHCFSFDL